jgi:uncharacterized protein (TIGR02118 family)
MAMLIALYGTPDDAVAFDQYYFQTHVPIAKRLPGLRSYQITRGPVLSPNGPSPWYLVAMLAFDSMQAIQSAIASPEGQATAADLANFATGGVELMFGDTATL